MKNHSTKLKKGCIIEYLQDNQPIIGCIVENQENQLKILNINKKTLKMSPGRLLPWPGPSLSEQLDRQNMLEQMHYRQNIRNKLLSTLNIKELWELLQQEVQEESVQWLANLIWADPDSDQTASLGRALLEAKTYFKFKPPKFIIHDQATVEAKIKAQQAAQEKSRLLAHGQVLFKALWNNLSKGQKYFLPNLPEDVEKKLKNLLLQGIKDPENHEFQQIWQEISKPLPEHPHMQVALAQAWGLVPRHYNYLLDQAGYEWKDRWSEEFTEEIKEQQKKFAQQKEPVKDLDLISIDSATTRDIDDAFSVTRLQDSSYRLKVGLACPIMFWNFGSPLDKAVAHRASSLYLPEGSAHMLPEILGTELFSLHQKESKPVLVADLSLDSSGNLLDCNFYTCWTKIKLNLSYGQAEKELKEYPEHSELSPALELAERLREKRISQGAVVIEQEEPFIRLYSDEQNETQVVLDEPIKHPLSQLIVSEFMIQVNQAAADWMNKNNLPALHRTQDVSISKHTSGIWKEPAAIYALMRELSGSKLETSPKPHAALGIDKYAPITSPLRRYPDLMNLGQIINFLNTGSPLWSKEKLDSLLSYISVRVQEASKIQRFRLRYWKLLYFKRWCKIKIWSAVVVAVDNQYVTISLPKEQILVRGLKDLFGEKVFIGQRFKVKLGKIDPLKNEIQILTAWEE